MQHSKANDLVTLIADDHVFVGHLAVGGMTRFLVVDIQCVGRGGSGWLDSFYQFITGAWRIADYAAVRRVVRLSS